MYKSVGFGEIKGHCRPAGARSTVRYSHYPHAHGPVLYIHTSALILLALQCHCAAVSPRFESVILKGSWTLGECVLNSEVEVKVFPLPSHASLSRHAQLKYDTTVWEVLHHLVCELVHDLWHFQTSSDAHLFMIQRQRRITGPFQYVIIKREFFYRPNYLLTIYWNEKYWRFNTYTLLYFLNCSINKNTFIKLSCDLIIILLVSNFNVRTYIQITHRYF